MLYKCNAQPMDCFVQNLLPISPTTHPSPWVISLSLSPEAIQIRLHAASSEATKDFNTFYHIFFFFRSSDPPDPFNCTNVKRSRGNGWREKKSVRAQQSRRITARNNTA